MLYVYCSTLPSLSNFASLLYYYRDVRRRRHELNVVQHDCVVLQFRSQKEQTIKIKVPVTTTDGAVKAGKEDKKELERFADLEVKAAAALADTVVEANINARFEFKAVADACRR